MSSTPSAILEMRTLWRGIARTVFWSYDRGSWPYDLMVITIALFVLLAPRSWFRDQPQTNSAESSGVELLTEDSSTRTTSYRLDASLLPAPKRTAKATPELERETHDILGRDVDSLKGQTFRVVRIDPVLAEDGSVVDYDVTVRP
jgi:hypothetical protein